MTYHGHIENGQVILDDSVALPEGAAVRVDLLVEDGAADNGAFAARAALYEVLSERYQSGETDVAARHNEHQP